MTLSFDIPVVCPTLIGRAAQLAAFERVSTELGNHRGQTLLVSGEAGIGKSRLVADIKARVRLPNIQLLQGNCFEQDGALPFAPFLDLFRMLLAAPVRDAHLAALAPYGAELIKLLPDLGCWLPEITPTPALEVEQEQRRLFGALAHVFTDLAAHGPIKLLIEDLHWIDDTSLAFLRVLARQVRACPLLVVLTYRTDEVNAALNHFLSGLDRERLALEFALANLSIDDVHAMIQAIFHLQRPVRRDFLDALYQLTDGNPFFVEEVLKSLLTAGDIFFADGMWDRKPLDALRIPRSIQDAVQQRANQLSDAARATLELAAVVGRRFDFALLQSVTQRAEPELVQLVCCGSLGLGAGIRATARGTRARAFCTTRRNRPFYARAPSCDASPADAFDRVVSRPWAGA